MLLVLFIFGIFCQIKFSSPVCTVNKNYGRAANSIVEMSLCTTNDCSSKSKALKTGTVYYHCDLADSSINYLNTTMKIQIFNVQSFGSNSVYACLNSANVWVTITRFVACGTKGPLTFTPYPNINELQVYVVGCNDQEEEFPDEDKPRLQISGFDSPPSQGAVFNLMHPSQQIVCLSNCNETRPTYTIVNGNELVIVRDHILVVKVQIITDADAIKLVEANCEASPSFPRNIQFYIANFINASITSFTEGKPRKPADMYDAGESISCSVAGYNSFKPNATGSTPRVKIEVVELDSLNQVGQRFTPNADQVVNIPENLPTGYTTIALICYFGDYDSNLSDSYYFVQQWRISIGARFLTKLETEKGFDESEGFDFSPGTVIKCNKKYYTNLTKKSYSIINLYILYGNRTGYPVSDYENYKGGILDQAPNGVMEFRRRHQNIDMYVYCVLENLKTTPAPIFAEDRPKVIFVYTHPKWKSYYHLIGFIIICQGSNIDNMALTCLDCLPDSRMEIKKLGPNQIQLEVPNTIRKNVIVTYQCSGMANRYNTTLRNIVLRVIVSHMTSIDTLNNLFMYNEDYLSCKATFTVVENRTAAMKYIIVPAMMKIDNTIIINKNGTTQKMLLIRNDETVVSPNKLAIFHGCCSTYNGVDYNCEAWKSMLVARNYRIRFNMDLNLVFPGNKLKCYICKNYTSEIRIASCTGINSIPSKIRMVVIDPVGNMNDTGFVDEVTAPIEGLKPDKDSFYKISEYNIEIGCLVRDTAEMITLNMKSCNMNPPPIMISPIDRTMFFVGDIFSCTTDDINCKHGLTYSIFVQKGTDSAERKDSPSFTLTKKHTGNNIKITCVAGEGGLSKDERMIRVEVGPYNVSITTIYKIMIYKRFLRCHALGFPFPVISWNQLKGPSILSVSESFLLVGPWDFSGNYSVQCEAKNERGSITVSADFQVFNPRINYSDYSTIFYLFVPLLTVIYIILVFLSLLIIFQESIFLVPFFSSGSYEAKEIVNTKRVSVASNKGGSE